MKFFKSNYEKIYKLVNKASLTTDSEKEKSQKFTLTIVAIIIAFLAIFWGSTYLLLGKFYSGFIPLIYAVLSFSSVIYYFYTKRYEAFRFSQLLLIFCFPFLMMWSLGGFAHSSVVLIWAFFTPLAAMLFTNRAHAAKWLYAFLILTMFSAFIDSFLSQFISPVNNAAITAFFILNIGFGFGGIFLTLNHFVKERENAYALILKAKKELEHSNLKLQKNEIEIKQLLMTDWLTGITNRRYLDQRLQDELDRFHRHGHYLTLIMADIDNFKKINDNHGHSKGDEVIKIFTEVMQENIRTIDLISRYGGEEFIIMLPETSLTGATELAERIRFNIENKNISGLSHPVTASFGITIAKENDTLESILKRVDQAMYKSKDKGRNCCTDF